VALGARRRSGWEAGRRSHASPAEEVTEGEQRSESGRGREEAPREAGGKRTKITASKVRLQLWGGVGTRRGCRTEGGTEGEGGAVRRRNRGGLVLVGPSSPLGLSV